MCSNDKENLEKFIDNIDETASKPELIELIVKVDTEDESLQRFIQKKKMHSKIDIFQVLGPRGKGYFDLWKWLNVLLPYTDPNAYFICNSFDEMYFQTKNWDDNLRKYVGLFPDNIFRLRTSIFKYRNYHDIWEPGYAPDSTAFYTKRWLDIVGKWNSCHGPDSYQQFVAYYLTKLNYPSKLQIQRDIPIPDIEIGGQGAGIGLEGEKSRIRTKGNLAAWNKLLSHPIQEDCNLSASLLAANIYTEKHNLTNEAEIIVRRKSVVVQYKITKDSISSWDFSLSKLSFKILKWSRFPYYSYYCGGFKDKKPSLLKGLMEQLYYYKIDIIEQLRKIFGVFHYLRKTISSLRHHKLKNIMEASKVIEGIENISSHPGKTPNASHLLLILKDNPKEFAILLDDMIKNDVLQKTNEKRDGGKILDTFPLKNVS